MGAFVWVRDLTLASFFNFNWECLGWERFLGEIGLGSFVVALGWRKRD